MKLYNLSHAALLTFIFLSHTALATKGLDPTQTGDNPPPQPAQSATPAQPDASTQTGGNPNPPPSHSTTPAQPAVPAQPESGGWLAWLWPSAAPVLPETATASPASQTTETSEHAAQAAKSIDQKASETTAPSPATTSGWWPFSSTPQAPQPTHTNGDEEFVHVIPHSPPENIDPSSHECADGLALGTTQDDTPHGEQAEPAVPSSFTNPISALSAPTTTQLLPPSSLSLLPGISASGSGPILPSGAKMPISEADSSEPTEASPHPLPRQARRAQAKAAAKAAKKKSGK